MIYNLLCVFLFLICFIQRASLTWRVRISFDSWGHIYFVSAVRNQKTGPFAPIFVNVLEGGFFHYPLFTHWILSFLPEHFFRKYVKLINPFFEALVLGICTAIVLLAGVDMFVALGAGLLYIFTPMMFSKVSIGPTSHFTTRIYSELSTGVLVLLAFLPLQVSWIFICWPIAFLVTYIVLSSKFGLQMLLLVVLPSAILTMKYSLIMGLFLGFIFAVLVSHGNIINAWIQQIRHLHWYISETRKGKMPISSRNGLAPLRDAFNKNSLREKVLNLIFILVGRNSFTALLIKFPVLIPVACIPLFKIVSGPIAENGFYVILELAIVIFILVNTTSLIVIGEGERYLNHFSYFIGLVFVEWNTLGGNEFWFWVVFFWGVIYWVFELVLIGLFRISEPSKDEDHAFTILVKYAPIGSVVLSYPYHVMPPWRLLAITKLIPIFPIISTGPRTSQLKSMESYPFIDLAYLSELRRNFGLAFVVTQNNKLNDDAKLHLKADGWWPLSGLENTGITIYTHYNFINSDFDSKLLSTISP